MDANSNIISRIFDHTTVKDTPGRGSLLVAEPFLRESYFRHAVIAMVDVPRSGAPMGVVLNNSTELHLDDVLGEVREGTDVPVYCGGPIGHDRLFFIHTLGSAIIPGAAEFAPGMFVGGDFAAVIDYVNSGYPTQGAVRFFLGYCGWSADQLRDEVNNDVWAVANGISVRPRKLLTLTGDAMWHTVVRALGPRYRLWNLHPVCTHAN